MEEAEEAYKGVRKRVKRAIYANTNPRFTFALSQSIVVGTGDRLSAKIECRRSSSLPPMSESFAVLPVLHKHSTRVVYDIVQGQGRSSLTHSPAADVILLQGPREFARW